MSPSSSSPPPAWPVFPLIYKRTDGPVTQRHMLLTLLLPLLTAFPATVLTTVMLSGGVGKYIAGAVPEPDTALGIAVFGVGTAAEKHGQFARAVERSAMWTQVWVLYLMVLYVFVDVLCGTYHSVRTIGAVVKEEMEAARARQAGKKRSL